MAKTKVEVPTSAYDLNEWELEEALDVGDHTFAETEGENSYRVDFGQRSIWFEIYDGKWTFREAGITVTPKALKKLNKIFGSIKEQ